jgi:hypothetical protein
VAAEWEGLLQIRKEELKNWNRSVAMNHTLVVLGLKPGIHIADPVYKSLSTGIYFIIPARIPKPAETGYGLNCDMCHASTDGTYDVHMILTMNRDLSPQ